MEWTLDRDVSVEGLATAFAAVLALLVYLTDLVGRRLAERRGKRANLRARMMLDIVQRDFRLGAGEEEIYTFFFDDEPGHRELRARYKVPRRRRTRRREDLLERQLVGLVYDHLLDFNGQDHYRVNSFRDVADELQRTPPIELLATLTDDFRRELTSSFWAIIESPTSSEWDIKRALDGLANSGELSTSDDLRSLLARTPDSNRLNVVSGVASHLSDR